MQRLRSQTVRLNSIEPIELKPGIVLPPGRHLATKIRRRLQTWSGGSSWSAPQFIMEFTADQLAHMGATKTEKPVSKIDVTKFVRDGRLNQR